MKKNRTLLILASSLLLASCGNETSFSMIEPYSEFTLGQEVKDEAENSVKINSLSSVDDYLIINVDLHCNKGDYIAFYYQVAEVEYCRFDIDATNENNKAPFNTGYRIYFTDYNIYFFGLSKLAEGISYHIDFGVVETGFASTYFVFSLADVSPISF